ncbi:hypothetical protein HMPREF3190_01737 [Umbribacter vaginalis]|nr:hypothetical protein HMPREF3190_01737 [Coriobacteriales bacterium DNF00809]
MALPCTRTPHTFLNSSVLANSVTVLHAHPSQINSPSITKTSRKLQGTALHAHPSRTVLTQASLLSLETAKIYYTT